MSGRRGVRMPMFFDDAQSRANRNVQLIVANNFRSQGMSSGLSSLRSPMIGRVYTAKPGCSACGK